MNPTNIRNPSRHPIGEKQETVVDCINAFHKLPQLYQGYFLHVMGVRLEELSKASAAVQQKPA